MWLGQTPALLPEAPLVGHHVADPTPPPSALTLADLSPDSMGGQSHRDKSAGGGGGLVTLPLLGGETSAPTLQGDSS